MTQNGSGNRMITEERVRFVSRITVVTLHSLLTSPSGLKKSHIILSSVLVIVSRFSFHINF